MSTAASFPVFNHHGVWAIYRFEMARALRTLVQSVVTPVITTSTGRAHVELSIVAPLFPRAVARALIAHRYPQPTKRPVYARTGPARFARPTAGVSWREATGGAGMPL